MMMNLKPFRHTNMHSLSFIPCFSTCATCIPNVGSALPYCSGNIKLRNRAYSNLSNITNIAQPMIYCKVMEASVYSGNLCNSRCANAFMLCK
jgi:hypothetical protein